MRMLAPDGPAAWAGSAARYSLPLDTDQVYRANSALHAKNQAPENDTKRMTKPSAAVLARRCVAGSTGSTTRRNNNARRVFSPLLLRRLVGRKRLVVFAEPTVGVAQQVIGIGVLRILGHHLAEAAGGQRPVLGFD